MNRKKVLIIKLGYSETLDKEVSEISSLGDVVRTTVILHLFKNDYVVWLTDEKAVGLLYNNPLIERIMVYNLNSVLQLENEYFDFVINFEKVPGICALTDRINAWKKLGFRFNPITGEAEAYEHSDFVMEIIKNDEVKKKYPHCWQESLFKVLGAVWHGEEYIIGYKPKTEVIYDIGFNYQVGAKWPTKAWKLSNWKELEKLCEKDGFSVSWQRGLKNLYEYMDWLNSCKIIVSNDSLGLHLALGLKKKVIGLFGATKETEVYFYNRGIAIIPEKLEGRNCRPCYLPECKHNDPCINKINPETVYREIIMLNNVE
jgi:heptosyltransferase-2